MRFAGWIIAGGAIGTALASLLLLAGLPEVAAGWIGTLVALPISMRGWP